MIVHVSTSLSQIIVDERFQKDHVYSGGELLQDDSVQVVCLYAPSDKDV